MYTPCFSRLGVAAKFPIRKSGLKSDSKNCLKKVFAKAIFGTHSFCPEISISRSPKFSSEFTYWIYSYLNPKKKPHRLPVPPLFRRQAVKGLGCVGSTCQSSVRNYLHRTPPQNDLWTPLVEHPMKIRKLFQHTGTLTQEIGTTT